METDYIYPATLVKTLENELLTDDQVNILLAGKTFEESYRSLHDTFLGPYIAEKDPEYLSTALEKVITDTKVLLSSVAPVPELLHILWLKYDFYNLKTILKGSLKELSDEEILKHCFESGLFDPRTLLEAFRNNRLSSYNFHFHNAVELTRSYREVSDIDRVMNVHYFRAIHDVAIASDDPFITDYVTLLIDIFNVQANLRAFSHGEAHETPIPLFVSGGRFREQDVNSKESVLASILRIGDPSLWKEAIETYTETGDHTQIERVADNYVTQFLKEKSYTLFSPASLVLYFQAKKNNVQMVRSILVGKQAGLPEYEIRRVLRKKYE